MGRAPGHRTTRRALTAARAAALGLVLALGLPGAAAASPRDLDPVTAQSLAVEQAVARLSGRAATVGYTLTVDGQASTRTTSAATWGQALAEAGVRADAGAGDSVSVSLTGAPTEGASLTVTHADHATDTVRATDAHTTLETPCADLDAGTRQVVVAGTDGVVETTYAVTRLGGAEVSRQALTTTVLVPRTDEVVLVGTRQGTASGSAAAQATARSLLPGYGWGGSELTCLVALWDRESSWQHTAENPSSGAYGIPQALPAEKMASAGADWRTNPTTQITWGLGYIASRYGSPCAAWAHSEQTGWY